MMAESPCQHNLSSKKLEVDCRCSSCSIIEDEDARVEHNEHLQISSPITITCGVDTKEDLTVELLSDDHCETSNLNNENIESKSDNSGGNELQESIHIIEDSSLHESEVKLGNHRKRHFSTKFSNTVHEPGAKRWNTCKDDVEIDISGLSSIRLKCNDNSYQQNDKQEDILNYLQTVDEKLDSIIKHFNVPFHPTVKIKFPPSSMKTSKKSSPPYLNNGGETTIRHCVRDSDMRLDAETPTEITQYVIADDLMEATYIKSRNRGNFAKNLVYSAFPIEERTGRNCYGRRGGALSGRKVALEPAKLDAVKVAVFNKFPVLDGDDEEAVWRRECVIAIDTALRSEMRNRIMRESPEIKFRSSDSSPKH